ncbi:methylated-DNA--[protein]-cysteine S-methyltransferase [bacterium]|nr:methylated-DNA--[protein]-cysteine S-methyltransferase [bacterium]
MQHDDRCDAREQIQSRWPVTKLLEKTTALASMIEQIFSIQSPGTARPFHLYLKGTNFQVNVWKALLSIPRGRTVSYQDVAAYIGSPESCRAVGNAVAINPVGYLIPCHRVIAKNGDTHGYRWGTLRKKAILGFESATF